MTQPGLERLRARRWAAWWVTAALLAMGLEAFAAESTSPVDKANLRAAILLRAMAYERGLATKRDALRITVLDAGDGDDTDQPLMASAFDHLAASVKVAGRVLVTEHIHYRNDRKVVTALKASHAELIYVPAHMQEFWSAYAESLSSSGAVMLCADPQDVGKGCMLSVEQGDGRSRLVIHLGLAQRLGLHFDGRLLQLARVIQ